MGDSDQPRLSGEKVELRPWRSDDPEAVFAACQDAVVMYSMLPSDEAADRL